jgi:Fuc2NAc and GlcNAc transferase
MTETGLYLASFIMGIVGAWIMARFGGALGILDLPNERSSHNTLTPKGGGIGVFAAFLFACLSIGISVYFWLPITILSILALWNDRIELSIKWRLSAQLFLAAILILGMGRFPTEWIWHLTWILFGIVFIVGTTNFYNFMDGINGIAGVTGVLGFGLLAFYSYGQQGQTTLFLLSICISLSILGFLPMNMPKARVFMGDVGSILLGSVFGALVYLYSKTFLDFFCMSSFLFPFYADELSTMALRLKNRENLIQAHRRHLYQLLANEGGITHWKITLGYGLFQVVIGLSVMGLKPYGVEAILGTLIFWSAVFLALNFVIRLRIMAITIKA